jgi:hypothetical protein
MSMVTDLLIAAVGPDDLVKKEMGQRQLLTKANTMWPWWKWLPF